MTVLDSGDGAELCLSGVAESLPPQCSGLPVLGWGWADHDGDYEEAQGTRWGDFVVLGTFDGSTITPSEVVAAREHDAPRQQEEDPRRTSCAEPAGGWVVDPDRVAMADYEAGLRAAHSLDGLVSASVDTSRAPRTPDQQDEDLRDGADEVSSWIVDVAVTADAPAAEAAIREVWGGCLRVTTGEVTQRELLRIRRAVEDVTVPGLLGSHMDLTAVHLHVVRDDGSIQAWADVTFGAGRVHVSSALVATAAL